MPSKSVSLLGTLEGRFLLLCSWEKSGVT